MSTGAASSHTFIVVALAVDYFSEDRTMQLLQPYSCVQICVMEANAALYVFLFFVFCCWDMQPITACLNHTTHCRIVLEMNIRYEAHGLL